MCLGVDMAGFRESVVYMTELFASLTIKRKTYSADDACVRSDTVRLSRCFMANEFLPAWRDSVRKTASV